MNFTDTQICILTNALRVAAVQYITDANVAKAVGGNHVRLVEQFEKQSREANELADYIDCNS